MTCQMSTVSHLQAFGVISDIEEYLEGTSYLIGNHLFLVILDLSVKGLLRRLIR